MYQSYEPNDGYSSVQVPPPPQPVTVQGLERQPWVTYGLLAVTILVYIAQLALTVDGYPLLVLWGAKINEAIVDGQFWRLLTPMFLHGSMMHIAFNMYALYALGKVIEPAYGHGRFLVLYILAGFTGNVLSFIMTPGVSVGASTAVFGLLAAEGIFWYQNRKLFGATAQSVLSNLVVVAIGNLVLGFAVPNIDNWGHIGGLIGGLLFAWFAGPHLALEGIVPLLRIVDRRDRRLTWLVAAMIGAFFAALVYVTMMVRS
ncbi:MAG: rhomboid family intramembrane serine protease [Chloroflexota bacterium]